MPTILGGNYFSFKKGGENWNKHEIWGKLQDFEENLGRGMLLYIR